MKFASRPQQAEEDGPRTNVIPFQSDGPGPERKMNAFGHSKVETEWMK